MNAQLSTTVVNVFCNERLDVRLIIKPEIKPHAFISYIFETFNVDTQTTSNTRPKTTLRPEITTNNIYGEE